MSEIKRGPEGREGQVGREGEKGREGKPGAVGAVGDTGAVGEAGAVGDTGSTGDTGATGDTGKTGATGATGDTGERGAALPRSVTVAFAVVVVVFFSTLSVLVVFIVQNRGLAQQGEQAHDVQCVQREKLAADIDRSRDYLKRHDEPILFGEPRATFEKALTASSESLAATDALLDC